MNARSQSDLIAAADGWMGYWRRRGFGMAFVGILVSLLMLWVVFGFSVVWWGPALALIAGGIAARVKWPRVKARHYFITRRIVFPVALLAGGWGLQMVIEALMAARLDWFWIVIGGLTAAATVGFLTSIFEGKLMKSIFDLVPVDQQAGLRDFVQNRPADAGGKFADFSRLDPQAVVAKIKGRVIGQDSIVTDVVTTAFRRARLRRPNKPVAVFLMVGATGAGKTELSKALAEEMFDGRMIRIDCNELSQPHNVARLIGAPPGYVGSDQGGQLCRDIGRVGTGVLLFDEIEKADKSVLKVIMSLLDEARLTEQSTGTTYRATGFLIVLTSNAAAEGIAKVSASVSDPQARISAVKDELKNAGFLPEVLARIDSIFPFTALSREAVTEIVGRFLMQFARDTGVELVGVDAALLIDLVTRQEKLADYGVREVVRLVENTVVDGLLSVKDAGHPRAAIRVVDGHVEVQPVE